MTGRTKEEECGRWKVSLGFSRLLAGRNAEGEAQAISTVWAGRLTELWGRITQKNRGGDFFAGKIKLGTPGLWKRLSLAINCRVASFGFLGGGKRSPRGGAPIEQTPLRNGIMRNYGSPTWKIKITCTAKERKADKAARRYLCRKKWKGKRHRGTRPPTLFRGGMGEVPRGINLRKMEISFQTNATQKHWVGRGKGVLGAKPSP